MAYAERRGRTWRIKYKRPDGTWGSESGFETKESALNWGHDQESDVRRNTWVDPAQAQTLFGDFAEQVMDSAKLASNTRAKYRSYLDRHLLPRWGTWSLGAIFNHHLEIEKWVKDLHGELAEPSVLSVFAFFSRILESATKARKIPANPARGVRVSSGAYEAEHQVATPAQFLRAAVRLHETFGHAGLVLTLMNGYTGARWSELVVLRPHDYDEINHAFPVRTPLRETAGKLEIAEKAKTPVGKRWVQLPPFLDALYTDLIESCEHEYLFTGPRGGLLRRGNFRGRFWRPAWDGQPTHPQAWLRRPILPGFTFHEGRHSHRTLLAQEGIPEVARAARLGHKVPGMASVYEHVTPAMQQLVRSVLEALWWASVDAVSAQDRERLFAAVPLLGERYRANMKNGLPEEPAEKMISRMSPIRV